MTLDLALLILRAVLLIVLWAHGGQKLFRWFGGGGMAPFTQVVGSIGFRPAAFWAWIAALTEFFGGVAVGLGFATRIAAALLILFWLVALYRNRKNGFWAPGPGIEYVMTLLAVTVVIFLLGSGAWSVDQALALPHRYFG